MKYCNDCMDIGGSYIINGENGKTASYMPAQALDSFQPYIDELMASGIEHFAIHEVVDPVSHKSIFKDPYFGYEGSTLEEVVGYVMVMIKEGEVS